MRRSGSPGAVPVPRERGDTLVLAQVTHEKVGHTNQGLWHHKGMQLPAYIQHIANDLISERGMDESRAIATAVSRCKMWCATSKDPAVKSKACAAVAEWEALKAASSGLVPVTFPVLAADWNPDLHPRGHGGKFSRSLGGGGHVDVARLQRSHAQLKMALARADDDIRRAEAQVPPETKDQLRKIHNQLNTAHKQLGLALEAHAKTKDEHARQEHVNTIKKWAARVIALLAAGIMLWMSAHGTETGPLIEGVGALGPIAAEFGIEKLVKPK